MIVKTVIFLRGNNRDDALKIMLPVINAPPNDINADIISMKDYSGEKAAKARSCRNLFSHCLENPNSILIINNENHKSSHWDPYLRIMKQMEKSRKSLSLGLHFGDIDNKLEEFKDAMDISVVNGEPYSIASQIISNIPR